MKINVKTLIIIFALFSLAMFFWNFHLLKVNGELQKDLKEARDNYYYLEGFHEVVKYDLTTARDSVRLLENKINLED